MSEIHVCALSKIADAVAQTGARSLLSLVNRNTLVIRPSAILPGQHLQVGMSDIVEPLEGHVLPGEGHMAAILDFVRGWDRREAMVIHCYAGVSRSTAAAFIAACALDPERDEMATAQELRRASPTATPNARLVALADAALQRGGRMVAAVAAIGRGSECFEGVPFSLAVPKPAS